MQKFKDKIASIEGDARDVGRQWSKFVADNFILSSLIVLPYWVVFVAFPLSIMAAIGLIYAAIGLLPWVLFFELLVWPVWAKSGMRYVRSKGWTSA